jgi:hypothetical protein
MRPSRHACRLKAEVLESRALLSVTNEAADASYVMANATPSNPAEVMIHVGGPAFRFRHNRVLLELEMQATAGGGPRTMAMTGQPGSSDKIVYQNDSPAVGGNDIMLVSVGPGNYAVQADMPDATGPLALHVSLVGDVNGLNTVTAQDIKTMKSLVGASVGQPGYSPAYDPTGVGTITKQDVKFAEQNVGATMPGQPLALTAGLDSSSNPDGNGVVTSPDVTISGQTAPGATVQLDQGATGTFTQTTTADAQGNYQFQVVVPIGVTPFNVEASTAGQQAMVTTNITRGDVVIAWNQTMLRAIQLTKDSLGLATRTMAMAQEAVYDAVNAIDNIGTSFHADIQVPQGTAASPDAAASEAAYDVLSNLIPQEQSLYNATLAESLASLTGVSSASIQAGQAIGDSAAADILAWRKDDGSTTQVPYVPGTAPGQWRPTPPDYSVAWGPNWGQVTPFAINGTSAFLPPPPPALNSPAYAAALKMTESLGAKNSTTRTPKETQIGDFWAYDTAGIGPPPVHLDQIVQEIALQQHNTLDQNARLLALVNTAIGDAGIVTWDAKFIDNRWRPITAIRDAGQDGNSATVADPNWTPLGAPGDGVRANFTPNFPSYVSGHSSFGGATFTVLADFYGTNNLTFTIDSEEVPGVDYTFNSLSAASEQNAISRIYLGIHFIFDETNGVAEGNAVGNYVYQNAMQPFGD